MAEVLLSCRTRNKIKLNLQLCYLLVRKLQIFGLQGVPEIQNMDVINTTAKGGPKEVHNSYIMKCLFLVCHENNTYAIS